MTDQDEPSQLPPRVHYLAANGIEALGIREHIVVYTNPAGQLAGLMVDFDFFTARRAPRSRPDRDWTGHYLVATHEPTPPPPPLPPSPDWAQREIKRIVAELWDIQVRVDAERAAQEQGDATTEGTQS